MNSIRHSDLPLTFGINSVNSVYSMVKTYQERFRESR